MSVKKYIENLLEKIEKRDQAQPEFIQAVLEIVPSLTPYLEQHPELVEKNILGFLLEPERIISFRVPWQDDQGNWQVNRAYRVQYNSALGPYKGGMRFHPSVNESILKFLGLEQTLKNSLTGLPIGGGKGGSDFDPKGKSEGEVMRFTQSLMTELQRYLGPDVDVPAGDIGVGAREVGYMYGQYKRLNSFQAGVLTGKPLVYGGSLGRTQATGYGLVYFVKNYLDEIQSSFENKKIVVSGSGNVALHAIEKAQALGAKIIASSDSTGYIYDPKGINLAVLKEIKEVERGRISQYLEKVPTAQYFAGKSVWSIEQDFQIALPCATQNEITLSLAEEMVKNGVEIIAEGANMPTALDAVAYFQNQSVIYLPGKAANAGGVAVSALEMAQNSQRLAWEMEKVDQELQKIMANIYRLCRENAYAYSYADDFLTGANIAGFAKVAEAMLSQGLV